MTESDPELDDIHLKTVDSQFEINKEALKPTISHASEIELNPILKPIPPKQELPLVSPDEAFVIEKRKKKIL